MSGFVCIMHGDNAPVDRALLHSLTDFLSFRGPDEQSIWVDRSIGMGHTLLRTTYESRNEKQPLSLEERYWTVADARLDAREDLIGELRRKKQTAQADSPDCDLILQAYAAWGESCVDHLRGDFSFTIWDNEHNKLFCARDHFGVKPFYYVQLAGIFLCSNTLNCLRLHPGVGDQLNEVAVGDFLLFGLNYDNRTTIFKDIQRLPPAHMLTVSSRGLQVKQYWVPPTNGRIRYSQPGEYVEHFSAILDRAVADRLRTNGVGILLSGGLDSSSIAAVVREISTKTSQAVRIRGYTHVYKSLLPHDDEGYARETGEFLQIPIKFISLDEVGLFEKWRGPGLDWPEPISNPLVSGIFDSYGIISSDCRVVLSGEGGDDLMAFEMWPYLRDSSRRAAWGQVVTDVAKYMWVRPFPWRGLRARVLRLIGNDPFSPVFPDWLEPEFARRTNLKARWNEGWKPPESHERHLINRKSHSSIMLPQWTLMFEQENAGVTGHKVETRYPFLDLRMVNFLLAIPPFPWFFKKKLLREALNGRLPERVRIRPKTPLQSDPVSAQLRRTGLERLNGIPWSPFADHYISRSVLVQPHAKMTPEQVSTHLRPYCLNIWLQAALGIRYNIQAETKNG